MPDFKYFATSGTLPVAATPWSIPVPFTPKAAVMFATGVNGTGVLDGCRGQWLVGGAQSCATYHAVPGPNPTDRFAYQHHDPTIWRERGPGGVRRTLTASWDAGTQSIVMTPSGALSASRSYVLLVFGGEDAAFHQEAPAMTANPGVTLAMPWTGLGNWVLGLLGGNSALDGTLAVENHVQDGAFDGVTAASVGLWRTNGGSSGYDQRPGAQVGALAMPISSGAWRFSGSQHVASFGSGTLTVSRLTFSSRLHLLACKGSRARVVPFSLSGSTGIVDLSGASFRPGAALLIVANGALSADIGQTMPSVRPVGMTYGVWTKENGLHFVGDFMRSPNGAVVSHSGGSGLRSFVDAAPPALNGRVSEVASNWSGKLHLTVPEAFTVPSVGVAVLFEDADQEEANPLFLNLLSNRP